MTNGSAIFYPGTNKGQINCKGVQFQFIYWLVERDNITSKTCDKKFKI